MVEYVQYNKEEEKRPKKRVTVSISSYVLILVLSNIIIFLAQNILPGFENILILETSNVWTKPWTLFTTMFLHANFAHLFFNMYALFLFGLILENKIGPKKFLISYITIGLIVSFASVFIYPGKVLGASGAVMGVIGMLVMIMPNLQLLFFFVLPIRLWLAGVIWFLLDLIGTFSPSTGIANLAHIVGFTLGLAYGYYLVRKGIVKRDILRN